MTHHLHIGAQNKNHVVGVGFRGLDCGKGAQGWGKVLDSRGQVGSVGPQVAKWALGAGHSRTEARGEDSHEFSLPQLKC